MIWKLFCDDDARTEGMESFRYPPSGEDDWKIACSSREAIHLIQTDGPPIFMSLDHDLGQLEDGSTDTVMPVINYLIEHHYDLDIDYVVHSQSPVGKLNIISKMESWKKSKYL